MSFSSELKEKIIEENIKNPCCKRAFVNGMLFGKAQLDDGVLKLNVSSDNIMGFVLGIIEEIYGKKPDVFRAKCGGRAKTLAFTAPSCEKYMRSLETANDLYSKKCKSCRSAFLRGAFLSSGRVCDPEKQYLLEFSLADHADLFIDLLLDLGIEAKINLRRSERLVYIKKSSSIEDFFTASGMNYAVFRLMDAKINNEIRNNANRLVNCETNNIGKAVNASHHQISVIKELNERGLLSSLPEELEKTALLRINHQDLSLAALSKISVPPISKSGLLHRLNKIMEIAQKYID